MRGERAAFLQAGHAVGACLYGIPVLAVSIIPADGADSWIDVEEPILPATGLFVKEADRIAARALIVALFAGPAVGQRYSFGGCNPDFTCSRTILKDPCVWRAANLARRLGSGSSAVHLLWREASQIADGDESWAAVERVAKRLLRRGQLHARDIERIIEDVTPAAFACPQRLGS